MRKLTLSLVCTVPLAALVACDGNDAGSRAHPAVTAQVAARRVQQVAPPLDLRTPPADAARTASGIVYKTLVANLAGAQPGPDAITLVRYTGWRPRTGDTFFAMAGQDPPIAIDLTHAAPGFREALPLLHKGEKAMLWLPPGEGAPETLAYEVELVDVVARSAGPGRTAGAAPPSAPGGSPDRRGT